MPRAVRRWPIRAFRGATSRASPPVTSSVKRTGVAGVGGFDADGHLFADRPRHWSEATDQEGAEQYADDVRESLRHGSPPGRDVDGDAIRLCSARSVVAMNTFENVRFFGPNLDADCRWRRLAIPRFLDGSINVDCSPFPDRFCSARASCRSAASVSAEPRDIEPPVQPRPIQPTAWGTILRRLFQALTRQRRATAHSSASRRWRRLR